VYQVGEIATYGGQTWINESPNNSYAPGVFGWVLYEEPQEPPAEPDLCVSTAAWDIGQATYYQTEVMAGRVVHVKYNNRIWKSKNATHLYIAPALSGNGAISWEFVKLCE
jgi:hypothetical protein